MVKEVAMSAWMLLLPFAVGFTSFFGVMIFKKIKQKHETTQKYAAAWKYTAISRNKAIKENIAIVTAVQNPNPCCEIPLEPVPSPDERFSRIRDEFDEYEYEDEEDEDEDEDEYEDEEDEDEDEDEYEDEDEDEDDDDEDEDEDGITVEDWCKIYDTSIRRQFVKEEVEFFRPIENKWSASCFPKRTNRSPVNSIRIIPRPRLDDFRAVSEPTYSSGWRQHFTTYPFVMSHQHYLGGHSTVQCGTASTIQPSQCPICDAYAKTGNLKLKPTPRYYYNVLHDEKIKIWSVSESLHRRIIELGDISSPVWSSELEVVSYMKTYPGGVNFPYHEINIIDAGPLGTTEEVASIMSQAFPLEELVKSWQKTPEELQRVLMEVCPPSQDEKVSLAYQTFKNRKNDFLYPCSLLAEEHWTAAVTH
jgi:hypothetical protein